MGDSLDLLDDFDVDIPLGAGLGTTASAADNGTAAFLGPYQLIQEVGHGGVAKVFRARHIHPGYADKTFAVKIIHDELSRDPHVVELFRHEAYVLSLLKHPSIVETFEAGNQDDKLFISMEYIDGRDLDNMVIRCQKSKIPLPMDIALYIIGESLRALGYAHDLCDADGRHLNLIHRDVNPANVFLSFDGHVKLGDFGVTSIAAGHVERDGQLFGKLGYFAPEQLLGDEVDQRVDVFAMGVMMFELLCGVRLFKAETPEQLMRLNRKAKIPRPSKLNPDLSRPIETIMLQALQRKPQERFFSTREMLEALEPFLPAQEGMSLAVASLMRKAFLPEHIQELQMRDGLAGVSQTRGTGQLVAVCTPDVRAQAAFNDLLLSRGFRVEVHATHGTLVQSLERQPVDALLLDVGTEALDARACCDALGQSRSVPVVAFAESLREKWLAQAATLGAVDFLFRPYDIERVLTSVRAAASGRLRVAQSAEGEKRFVGERFKPRVLVLSRDLDLIGSLCRTLAERGFQLDVSPTVVEAFERIRHASYHFAIYDAYPATVADRAFIASLRDQPGVGAVPVLYLATREDHGVFEGIEKERCQVTFRNEDPGVLLDILNRLRGDMSLGRSFVFLPPSTLLCAMAVEYFRAGLSIFLEAES